MARNMKSSESPAPGQSDLYDSSPPPSHFRGTHTSASPGGSTSSDKENSIARFSTDKGKRSAPMGPPRVPSPSGKRKRMAEQRESASQERVRRRRVVEVGGDDAYDPEQDINERRRIRKGLRDISKSLADNKNEYLEAGSTGLRDAILNADGFASQVKQTSDATIDSKLLLNAAELTMKRAAALVSGDTAQSVDVDDFIGRCILFMRNADSAADDDEGPASATQRQRRARREEDDDNGEHLNWAHLGRYACLKHNSRPSVPGFLLGPLSLEKRAIKIVVRKAAFKHSNIQETRPEVLNAADIQADENANLSELCRQIYTRLAKVREDSMAAVDEETTDDMTEKEGAALKDRYGVCETGGVSLFKFVINPYSFGQSVENLFYVSFLIRDGKVGISTDDRGLPYLDPTKPGSGTSGTRGGPSKHQAVISLDMALWKELIDVFEIEEPIIRHREEEQHGGVGARGWYT